MNINWNEKIRMARAEKGLSQKQVAEQLQMSRTCYANYEQGTREPSLDALRRICDFFDLSADYIIGRLDY